ncbi:hypothetical protein [Maridesulfovibrio salexigens]|uniref:Uncharacterized protein n=1 Tax=Maridesulfovibrio salexigens (strain ATCC 14822 / DSM 2638 / NCIMB 8403 / VKM B-1763) TaxID=526222 RepID=C6C0N8_MARSD|nr:hypothetical protein [Maridesulfovibrio salexigens]ACS80985.1 hypothetical protein Desal_2933 [Maridesulfovibrio salexigens DSM 2638]
MRINESSGFKFNIFDMKKPAEEEVNSTHQQVVEKEPQGHSYSSRNMMAGNFFQHDREQSRYITGLITSYDIADQFRSQMQSVANVYSDDAKIMSADMPSNYRLMGLAVMEAEHFAEEQAEDYAGEKLEEKLEKDHEEQEEDLEKKIEEKIEEKLMPDGAKQVLDADPDPEELTEEIAEKVEEATEARGDKILKGSEQDEPQTIAGNVQAAEQVSTVAAASSVAPEGNKKAELTGESTQTVQGGSASVGTVPPPGTYVDEVV